MKKKLSLSNLSKDAICKEDQNEINGGTACAQCWTDWENCGKTGGYSYEQSLNAKHTGSSWAQGIDFYSHYLNGGW